MQPERSLIMKRLSAMQRIGKAVVLAVVAGAFGALASTASAQTSEVKVDWKDPEIRQYMAVQRSTRAAAQRETALRGLSRSSRNNITKLKLPVLGFTKPLSSAARSLSAQSRPKPNLLMDEANPVWYSLEYQYGEGVTVTVEADLRVRHKLPPDPAVSRRATSSESDISVFDDTSEVGMVGAITEFQVYKFGGVPYTVTVECSEAQKAICRDVKSLRNDKQLLSILSARPPGQ